MAVAAQQWRISSGCRKVQPRPPLRWNRIQGDGISVIRSDWKGKGPFAFSGRVHPFEICLPKQERSKSGFENKRLLMVSQSLPEYRHLNETLLSHAHGSAISLLQRERGCLAANSAPPPHSSQSYLGAPEWSRQVKLC